MADAGIVDIDGREEKYITDVIPLQISSSNIAPTISILTKSSSVVAGRKSKTIHFQSGKKIPCRSRMPVSSLDSKPYQRDESDLRVGVKMRKEDEEEEEEIVGMEGRRNVDIAQEKET